MTHDLGAFQVSVIVSALSVNQGGAKAALYVEIGMQCSADVAQMWRTAFPPHYKEQQWRSPRRHTREYIHICGIRTHQSGALSLSLDPVCLCRPKYRTMEKAVMIVAMPGERLSFEINSVHVPRPHCERTFCSSDAKCWHWPRLPRQAVMIEFQWIPKLC